MKHTIEIGTADSLLIIKGLNRIIRDNGANELDRLVAKKLKEDIVNIITSELPETAEEANNVFERSTNATIALSDALARNNDTITRLGESMSNAMMRMAETLTEVNRKKNG